VDDLVAIARRAVADARKGNARARNWVSKYLLGEPNPPGPPGSDGWKAISQALVRALHEDLSQRQAAGGPVARGGPQEDPVGGTEAPRSDGLATPPPERDAKTTHLPSVPQQAESEDDTDMATGQ
jgi:hypothetical protein